MNNNPPQINNTPPANPWLNQGPAPLPLVRQDNAPEEDNNINLNEVNQQEADNDLLNPPPMIHIPQGGTPGRRRKKTRKHRKSRKHKKTRKHRKSRKY